MLCSSNYNYFKVDSKKRRKGGNTREGRGRREGGEERNKLDRSERGAERKERDHNQLLTKQYYDKT